MAQTKKTEKVYYEDEGGLMNPILNEMLQDAQKEKEDK